MMQIESPGPPIDSDQFDEFESVLGARLSIEYKQFLLRYNGGVPDDDTIDVPGATGMPTDVQVFFGFNRPVASSNLEWNLDLVKRRCPGLSTLPIACDSGGNLFCLLVEDGHASAVVYVCLSNPCQTHRVASSFNKFTAMLRSFH